MNPHIASTLQKTSLLRTMALSACCSMFFAACVMPRGEESVSPLRAGTSGDYKPLIYQNDGRLLGAEPAMIERIAGQLNRPLKFVLLSPDECPRALLSGEIDLWIGGITAEDAQQARVAFSEPFLQAGQMILCRREHLTRYRTMRHLNRATVRVGVRKGSRAERVVPRVLPRATIALFDNEESAVRALVEGRGAAFYVDDAVAVWQRASAPDSALAMLPFVLSADLFIWAVHPENAELREQVNRALRQWKEDGTLKAILKQWVPLVR